MGGIYQNGFVCYNPLNNSRIHKLTKTLSHPSFTYNHMDDTSHYGQKVVENAIFLAHIPVTQYSFANLHFRRRWALSRRGLVMGHSGTYPKIKLVGWSKPNFEEKTKDFFHFPPLFHILWFIKVLLLDYLIVWCGFAQNSRGKKVQHWAQKYNT